MKPTDPAVLFVSRGEDKKTAEYGKIPFLCGCMLNIPLEFQRSSGNGEILERPFG
jgi:hypothetical protein